MDASIFRSTRFEECSSPIDLLKCLLGLNEVEAMTLIYILSNPGLSCEDIASKIDKNKNSVQRGIKNLFDRGYVTRESVPLEGKQQKGFKYIYRPLRNELTLKNELLEVIESRKEEMIKLVGKMF